MEVSAYHEAGHAFMALYVGAKVRSMTIDPDRDDGPRRFGDTQILWRKSRWSEQEFRERAVMVALAGPVAEMIYTGDPYHPGHVAEWAADWAEAWEMAGPLHPDQRKRLAFLEAASLQLYRLLNQEACWAALADLADNLLAHETLEGEQVEEIVAEWLP